MRKDGHLLRATNNKALASVCPHPRGTHMSIRGTKDGQGRFRSRQSAEYPEALANALAYCFASFLSPTEFSIPIPLRNASGHLPTPDMGAATLGPEVDTEAIRDTDEYNGRGWKYLGPSLWANPHRVNQVRREQAVEQYDAHLRSTIKLCHAVPTLGGTQIAMPLWAK